MDDTGGTVIGAGRYRPAQRRKPRADEWSARRRAAVRGGLENAIAVSDGPVLTLRSLPAFAVEAGALVELVEGCDKSIATCTARFDNAANFRGEPYLPGIDLLTRYPGA